MSVGQIEKKTQQRVVRLFKQALGYKYLGDWAERSGNTNIEAELLRGWLLEQGVEANLASRAFFELNRVANDASKGLYERNKAVYELLRYGVKIKPEVGENTQTVWLINWKQPERNHFAIAEEVTVKGADAKAHSKRPDIVLYVNAMLVTSSIFEACKCYELFCKAGMGDRCAIVKHVLDQWGKDAAEALGDHSAGQDNERLDSLLELVKHQHEY